MNEPFKKLEGTRPRIVILEDDDGVRRSLQLLLQGRGFDVKAYANSASLLADPEVLNAACLISDFRLEQIDGITVLQGLRARDWTGPAILMTAFGSAELAARARSAGFAGVIEKPFKNHVLVTVLQRLTTEPAADQVKG